MALVTSPLTMRRICDGDFGRQPYCIEVELPMPNRTHNTRGAVYEMWKRTWRKASYLHLIWRRTLHETCQGKHVVDVGASVGPYALYFASRGCHVVAVEPDWRSFGHLSSGRNASRLGARMRLIHAAISATPRNSSTLRLNNLDYGETHLISAMGRFVKATTHRWMRTTVPALDLASVLGGLHRVDLLKIDVSGSELSVVCSARTMLSTGRVRNVLVTVDWNALSTFQGRFLRAQLEGSGFRMAPAHRAPQNWNWDDFFGHRSVGTVMYEWTESNAVRSCAASCSCYPLSRFDRSLLRPPSAAKGAAKG